METQVQQDLSAIDKIVQRHRSTPGSAIPILQEIQNTLGYVSPVFLQRVADLTFIPASDLFSIVTFYSQFRLEPLGETHVQICHGTACHLAGAERITDAFQHETGTSCGCTSEDGKFTLEKVACLGCCSLAPVVSMNGEIHGRLTPDNVKKVVKQSKALKEEVHPHGQ